MNHNKHNQFSQNQNQQPSRAPQPAAVAELKRNEADFAPSADEVARKAFFTYENEGSPQGRDVQHWLAAEAQLITERNLTRVHGFHNKT
jgi:uncharacterized protein with von Willebrand factor type A (vWA) domain